VLGPSTKQRLLIALILGAMLLVYPLIKLIESPLPAPQTKANQRANKGAEDSGTKNEPSESVGQRLGFWERTFDDPIAFYTFVLAIFTGVLGTVSLIQLTFIFRADRTARITANAAMSSANTAVDTVDEMRRNSWHELRAYIVVTIGPRKKPTGEVDDSALTVACLNTGVTPAYMVNAHLNTHTMPPGYELPAGFEYPVKGSKTGDKSVGVLGHGQSMAFDFDIDLTEIGNARAGYCEFFVYGHVAYQLFDRDGRIYYTRFCYQYVSGGETKEGKPIHGLRMCERHNDAD
jgi:hypothetical protein